jgi:ABC-type multidrug transport system fused ATPase/permease subunit
LKRIVAGIVNILTNREKIELSKLILFDLVIGVLDVAFLGLLLVVVNFYTQNDNAANIAFLPRVFANKNSLLLISSFLVLFGIKNWLGYLNSKVQNVFFYDVSSRLSRLNIQSYFKQDYSRFVHIDSSVLIHKISQQPIEFGRYILTNAQQVVSQSILIGFTVVAILFYHPGLFFLLFILLLPPVVILAWFIRKKLKTIRANTRVTSQKTIQHLQESLAGFVESNVYDKGDFFINRYDDQQRQLNDNIASQQTLQGLASRLVEVFAVLGFFILMAINKLSVNAPAISMITIGVFMAASYKIIPGMIKILNSTGQMKTYEFTLTDLVPANNTKVPVASTDAINSIAFEDLGFSYKGEGILSRLSFEMQAGDFIGISGKSGRGKTTLINLLLGFLKPDEGKIYINQIETNTAERQGYWSRISYVKQQPFIINDSILKNITLTDGGYDADRLARAIDFCGLDNLINSYPEGINTTVKENGKNISGGQRQRVMLARAMYHDFDLLILDEAFAEIDDMAERDLLEKLQGLAQQGKLIILITHNKASLQFCDKVILLDKVYA